MGMGTGLLFALKAVSTGASIISRQGAAERQETLLREQMNQERLAANEQSLARNDQLKHTLASQTAMAAARGYSLASPTFAAIQEGSFQNYFKDERAAKLNIQFRESAMESQIDALHAQANAGIFGSLLNFGMSSFLNSDTFSGFGGL